MMLYSILDIDILRSKVWVWYKSKNNHIYTQKGKHLESSKYKQKSEKKTFKCTLQKEKQKVQLKITLWDIQVLVIEQMPFD